MGVSEVIPLTLTLPAPAAPPSLSRWEREGARSAQPSGKGEGEWLEGAHG